MDIRRLLGQAIHALQNGDLFTASRLASQVLTQQPNEANSLQILGNVSAQQGQHEQALAHYEKGLRVNPKHIHLLNFAGLSAKKIDAFKRAEDYFLRAVAVDPNYFHADYNLANLYKADYQFKLAEEHLRKVVRVAPQFIAAQASLADLLEQTHRLQEAQALCHTVLAVDGQHYLARLTLANIAMRRKQWREVKDGLSPVLANKALSPVNYSVAAGLIAQAEEKMAKFPQALTLFSQANRVLQQFYDIGVQKHQVFVEEFVAKTIQPIGALHNVDISLSDGQQHCLQVAGNQTVLDVAQQQGIDLPHACGTGLCGSCKFRVNQGTSKAFSAPGISDMEIAMGYTLACQCKPMQSMTLVEFD